MFGGELAGYYQLQSDSNRAAIEAMTEIATVVIADPFQDKVGQFAHQIVSQSAERAEIVEELTAAAPLPDQTKLNLKNLKAFQQNDPALFKTQANLVAKRLQLTPEQQLVFHVAVRTLSSKQKAVAPSLNLDFKDVGPTPKKKDENCAIM